MNSAITSFKDIYPIEKFTPSSSYSYIFYIAFALFIIALIFIIFKMRKKRQIDQNIKALKELDFSSNITKEKLYKFTILAKKTLNNELESRLNEILQEIEPYKYKKSSPKIEQKSIDKIKRYIEDATK